MCRPKELELSISEHSPLLAGDTVTKRSLFEHRAALGRSRAVFSWLNKSLSLPLPYHHHDHTTHARGLKLHVHLACPSRSIQSSSPVVRGPTSVVDVGPSGRASRPRAAATIFASPEPAAAGSAGAAARSVVVIDHPVVVGGLTVLAEHLGVLLGRNELHHVVLRCGARLGW